MHDGGNLNTADLRGEQGNGGIREKGGRVKGNGQNVVAVTLQLPLSFRASHLLSSPLPVPLFPYSPAPLLPRARLPVVGIDNTRAEAAAVIAVVVVVDQQVQS